MALARLKRAIRCKVVPSGSDRDGGSFAELGGSRRDDGKVGSRALSVTGSGGRPARVIPRFNQVDPPAGTSCSPLGTVL